MMTLMQVGLDDKYRLDAKRIYVSGIQALVRLPMLQRERDRLQNLNTAGFISGYRGSPLGMYDNALWRAKSFLQAQDIAFVPGLNEDLAATAVWGSQQVGMFPGAKVDGVFGIWYGKGPGVDRSVDALKHANSAGTSRHGGVLALAGDDHGCQSSTLAHQSEQVFAAALMPILNPATLQDYLDLGLYGFALSRFSGCWVGFKAISETVESSASIHSDPTRIKVVLPTDFDMPPGGLSIRWPDPPLEQERRLHGPKLAAVAAFARANQLDRIVLDSKPARLGILATGKAYLDLRQALADLGISEQDARKLGLRIYKVAMTWPLEESGARAFAEGLQDVLVVEEKRGFIEDQLVRILYNMDAARRPSVVGKRDERGVTLLPSEGELTPTMVAAAVVARLRRLGHQSPVLEQRLARLEAFEHPVTARAPMALQRVPDFCSGCPHNTSTKVPEGSRAVAGIGCHGMALSIPSRRTATISHMGAEGVSWIGQAPFTSEAHIFQNLGDGTYTHSGLLALRAAAAAGVNITYKILYNDAVAMTGGQPAEGGLTVSQIAHQVWAEGAKRVAIVSDDPGKYPAKNYFPKGATVHHRRELDRIQRELREVAGLSVLIYDQTCAAEKTPPPQAWPVSGSAEARLHQRPRLRGLRRLFADLQLRLGAAAGNRIRPQAPDRPVELQQGLFLRRGLLSEFCHRAWRQAQEGGNLLDRFRPAVRRPAIACQARTRCALQYPCHRDRRHWRHHDRRAARHGRASRRPRLLRARLHRPCAEKRRGHEPCPDRAGAGRHRHRPHCLRRRRSHSRLRHRGLGQSDCAEPGRTRRHPCPRQCRPTAHCQLRDEPRHRFRNERDAAGAARRHRRQQSRHYRRHRHRLGPDGRQHRDQFLHARHGIPERLHSAFAGSDPARHRNQRRRDRDEQAGLLLGPPRRPRSGAGPQRHPVPHRAQTSTTPTLDESIATRAKFLTDYQNQRYADLYLAAIAKVKRAEAQASPGSTELTEAVAKNLFKLMAYKDEYEVARLYTDDSFAKKLGEKFEGDVRLKFHLAAPLLARRDKVTGHLQKKEYGGWMLNAFRLLARLKFLRGTAFDPFGYTAERKAERKLVDDYLAMIEQRMATLKVEQIPLLAKLARLPEAIRGYGHIKEASIAKSLAEQARLETELDNSRFAAAAE